MTSELEQHLLEMGIVPAAPKAKKPNESKLSSDVVWPKEKPVYKYNDPRDPVTGEVPF